MQRREASGSRSRACNHGVEQEEGCLRRRGPILKGQFLPGEVGFF